MSLNPESELKSERERSRGARQLSIYMLALSLSTSIAGCTIAPTRSSTPAFEPNSQHRNGPPDHAPAHGFRRKFRQHGVELRFDRGLDLYVVVDLTDVFFRDGRYFRLQDGRWSVSARPSGGWSPIEQDDLPKGLHGYGHGSKSRGHGKGRHKAR